MSNERKLPALIGMLDRVLTWVSLICGGATIIFMTGLSVFNVLIMRKAMNSPIVGAEDLLILSLVVIVALSIPFGARSGAHIEIEVLEAHMSKGFAKWSLVFVKLLGTVLLAFMSWRLWHAGLTAQQYGETSQQLLISFEPFYYLLSISAALYAVIILLDIWQILWSGRVQSLVIGADQQ